MVATGCPSTPPNQFFPLFSWLMPLSSGAASSRKPDGPRLAQSDGGGGLSPHVHDAAALAITVALQVGQGEGGQPADGEALVLPGQDILSQVDLLVHHGEPHLGELVGGHLQGGLSGAALRPCAVPWLHRPLDRWPLPPDGSPVPP